MFLEGNNASEEAAVSGLPLEVVNEAPVPQVDPVENANSK